MSAPILCQIRRAENPFFIEEIDLNIYSIEELCYYIIHNVPLLDRDFFGASLQNWLKDELRVRVLVSVISDRMKNEEFQLEKVVLPIIDAAHYLNQTDEKSLIREIQDFDAMPTPVQMKKKADTLTENHRFMKAIHLYQRILHMQGPSNLGTQFVGTVYNNMGIVYAKLFQWAEAADCMKAAYERLHSHQTLHNYLSVVRLHRGDAAFQELAVSLGVDRETVENIRSRMDAVAKDDLPEKVDEVLSTWVREYHRATGY